jgi:hypothetical protein
VRAKLSRPAVRISNNRLQLNYPSFSETQQRCCINSEESAGGDPTKTRDISNMDIRHKYFI